jgi:hypothetical protein
MGELDRWREIHEKFHWLTSVEKRAVLGVLLLDVAVQVMCEEGAGLEKVHLDVLRGVWKAAREFIEKYPDMNDKLRSAVDAMWIDAELIVEDMEQIHEVLQGLRCGVKVRVE